MATDVSAPASNSHATVHQPQQAAAAVAASANRILFLVVVSGADLDCLEEGKPTGPRYTRDSLRNLLQLLGCKPRLAYKIMLAVFQAVDQAVTTARQQRISRKTFQVHPHRNGKVYVSLTRADFMLLVSTCAAQYSYKISPSSEELKVACSLRERRRCVVVLLCGTSGSGKSTLASILAGRLGITTVVSTDSIRHMLRSFISRESSPLLWASTYQAGEYVGDSGKGGEAASESERALGGYKAQCELLSEQLEVLIAGCEARNQSLICEGVHFNISAVVKLMSRHPSMLPFLVYIPSESKHVERMAVRAKYMTLDPNKNRYVRYMGNIRLIQEYLVRKADKYCVPRVDNSNMDRSVGIIHLTVMGCLRRMARGEPVLDPSTGRTTMLAAEYAAVLDHLQGEKDRLTAATGAGSSNGGGASSSSRQPQQDAGRNSNGASSSTAMAWSERVQDGDGAADPNTAATAVYGGDAGCSHEHGANAKPQQGCPLHEVGRGRIAEKTNGASGETCGASSSSTDSAAAAHHPFTVITVASGGAEATRSTEPATAAGGAGGGSDLVPLSPDGPVARWDMLRTTVAPREDLVSGCPRSPMAAAGPITCCPGSSNSNSTNITGSVSLHSAGGDTDGAGARSTFEAAANGGSYERAHAGSSQGDPGQQQQQARHNQAVHSCAEADQQSRCISVSALQQVTICTSAGAGAVSLNGVLPAAAAHAHHHHHQQQQQHEQQQRQKQGLLESERSANGPCSSKACMDSHARSSSITDDHAAGCGVRHVAGSSNNSSRNLSCGNCHDDGFAVVSQEHASGSIRSSDVAAGGLHDDIRFEASSSQTASSSAAAQQHQGRHVCLLSKPDSGCSSTTAPGQQQCQQEQEQEHQQVQEAEGSSLVRQQQQQMQDLDDDVSSGEELDGLGELGSSDNEGERFLQEYGSMNESTTCDEHDEDEHDFMGWAGLRAWNAGMTRALWPSYSHVYAPSSSSGIASGTGGQATSSSSTAGLLGSSRALRLYHSSSGNGRMPDSAALSNNAAAAGLLRAGGTAAAPLAAAGGSTLSGLATIPEVQRRDSIGRPPLPSRGPAAQEALGQGLGSEGSNSSDSSSAVSQVRVLRVMRRSNSNNGVIFRGPAGLRGVGSSSGGSQRRQWSGEHLRGGVLSPPKEEQQQQQQV